MHLLNIITMLNTLTMVQRKVFIVHSSKMFFTYVLFLQKKNIFSKNLFNRQS